jgi:hypothetical protein
MAPRKWGQANSYQPIFETAASIVPLVTTDRKHLECCSAWPRFDRSQLFWSLICAQPTRRLFAAAGKAFGAPTGQPGDQPAPGVVGNSMNLHEMLLQAPAMKQGKGALEKTVDQKAAAYSTAQSTLGIPDPENVRVTPGADGSLSLSRQATDGSGAHQPFATLDPKTNRITLTPGLDGQLSQAALDMAAQSTPGSIPIHLPGGQPPFSEAEVSDLIAKGLQSTTSTTDRKAADAALTAAGLSPAAIEKMRNEGRLSVQDAIIHALKLDFPGFNWEIQPWRPQPSRKQTGHKTQPHSA